MSAEPALTAAVITSPDDDLPRLVYADWCEENGEPERAEFIRVQCVLARPDGLTADRLADLRIREQTLLEIHGKAWLAPLRRRGEPLFSPRTHGRFHRGFVETVWMPAAVFLKKGDRLVERCPVRELRVTQVTEMEWWRVLSGEPVTRLEALDLSERRLGNTAALYFTLHFPWPARKLTRLRMRACGIDDDGADVLAGIPQEAFAPTELDVSLNPLTRVGLTALRERYGAAVRFD